MKVGSRARAGWLGAAASSVGIAAALLFLGAQTGQRTESTARTTAVSGAATPAAYAGQSRVFGLVKPGAGPGGVLFAEARKSQPAGPETVRPTGVRGYRPLGLASNARIWVTAPIADQGVTDWIRGVRVSPEQFHVSFTASQRRYGPMLDRARMFELWFDDQGAITQMRHYFSP